MNMFRAAIHRLAASVSEVDVLYRFCRRVVDHHEGDNEGDMNTNGELRLMRAVLPSATVVFDVGANVGDWTAAALRINPDAQYHCFEPSRATFAGLRERRLPANVTLNNRALGAVQEQRTLHIFGERLGANSLYDRKGTDAETERLETIDVDTLDDYCRRCRIDRIDMLKVDTEGHELAVLQGALGMLRSGRIDAIQFEYGGTYIDARIWLKDVWALVAGANPEYQFYKLHGSGPRRVEQYRQTHETFQYSNWAILRTSR